MKQILTNILIILCLGACQQPETHPTIVGDVAVESPIIKDLLYTRAMQRLHDVDQHGVNTYFMGYPTFDRHQHSLDVYALVKKFGGSELEQVAALLHDVSHTAFSHLGDFLFKVPGYQDSIHDWYLTETDIKDVLEKYGIKVADVNPDQPAFTRLEQDHPDLCADRIAYILRTGLVFGFYTQQEIDSLIQDLRFEDGKWFFTTKESAQKMANLTLYFTERFWSSQEGMAANHIAALLLKYLKEKDIISHHTIHFGIDKEILCTVHDQQDPYIKGLLNKLYNILNAYTVPKEIGVHDIHMTFKSRVVDPWVMTEQGLQRLSEIDARHQMEFQRMEKLVKKGYWIRLK